MARSYKTLLRESEKTVRERDKRIIELEKKVTDLQVEMTTNNTAHVDAIAKKDEQIGELETEKETLEEQVETLESAGKTKDEQIRTMELSRFAKEYKDQEDHYAKQQEKWFKRSLMAAAVLIASVLGAVFNVIPSANLYQDPEVLFLNAILLTLFIYSLRQHSHLANLRDDYANRRALAQSYQYMVEKDETEDFSDIETKFFERAVEIFTRKPAARGKDIGIHDAIFTKLFGPKQ